MLRQPSLVADASVTALASIEAPTAATVRELRLGVVGLGARAGVASWAHGESAGARVVAVADPDPQTKERAHSLFGEGVDFYDGHEGLIEHEPPLDAAFVVSPDDTHAAVTVDLLRAGIAVYLEKPIATRTDDADAILAAAYESGSKLYVGHNMRHMAVVALMRRLIREGAIGEVKTIWCRHFVGHGGDFYFKDWHAEQAHTTGLLLQKGAHDIDVMHWLAGGYTVEVVGMGAEQVYGDLARGGLPTAAHATGGLQTWPPTSQTGLNPATDVEDTSILTFRLDNGVLCSYQQCHFTPDYWRNYSVIGTEGRLENFGDGEGGVVKVWNRRHAYAAAGDVEYPIEGDLNGHGDADRKTVAEFLDFIRGDISTDTSPLGARQAVVVGIEGTESLRNGSLPRRIPPVPSEVVDYFEGQQRRSSTGPAATIKGVNQP